MGHTSVDLYRHYWKETQAKVFGDTSTEVYCTYSHALHVRTGKPVLKMSRVIFMSEVWLFLPVNGLQFHPKITIITMSSGDVAQPWDHVNHPEQRNLRDLRPSLQDLRVSLDSNWYDNVGHVCWSESEHWDLSLAVCRNPSKTSDRSLGEWWWWWWRWWRSSAFLSFLSSWPRECRATKSKGSHLRMEITSSLVDSNDSARKRTHPPFSGSPFLLVACSLPWTSSFIWVWQECGWSARRILNLKCTTFTTTCLLRPTSFQRKIIFSLRHTRPKRYILKKRGRNVPLIT